MQLAKGANVTLPAVDGLTVACSWVPRPGVEADLSALLLAGGRVRDDSDFVFYNQPSSGDQRVVHEGKRVNRDGSTTDRVTVDLVGFDPGVEAVAFAVSLDAPHGRSFADLQPLQVQVSERGGARLLAGYRVDGLGPETAVVTVELYRRGAVWKVRAVGQGHHDGLAGLARDFGVDIGDSEPEPVPADPPPSVEWRNPPVPAGYEL
ncbi:TerD family protein [Pseudonocardia nigra]|uniref:TerD family protein n=1 Tax=Pseudonocardia nigra TaxID=1921578 RepID=UPI001C5D0D12|nr:TerD family protein [Pseudonocardia nigra]